MAAMDACSTSGLLFAVPSAFHLPSRQSRHIHFHIEGDILAFWKGFASHASPPSSVIAFPLRCRREIGFTVEVGIAVRPRYALKHFQQ